MDEKLINDIKNIVDSIFSEKEKASQMSKTQDALNESAEAIESLTQSLEDTKAELTKNQENSSQEIEIRDSKITEITTELEAAKKQLSEVESELASVKDSLNNMKKDQLTEVRMTELKTTKVVMANDIESQTAKVREMSDEEFASYKEDRIALRQAVEKELEAAAELQKTMATNMPAGALATETVKDPVTTPPVNIAPGHAMAAAMNFEIKPSDTMIDKYAALGKAMAENLKSRSDK